MRLALFGLFLWVSLAVSVHAQTVCAPAVLSSINIHEETAGFSIDVNYPVLCQSAASLVVRDAVTSALGEFKAEFPEHDLSDFPHKYEMLTEYSAWQVAKGRFASVQLQVMVYTGGAHPNNWPETWVFDMADGRVLTLGDVFADVGAALEFIAPMVQDVVRSHLGPMALPDMLAAGTEPVEGNYEDFILNDEGLVFFFAPYQVAPYAAGQQVVTIPWERIYLLLRPDMKELLQ